MSRKFIKRVKDAKLENYNFRRNRILYKKISPLIPEWNKRLLKQLSKYEHSEKYDHQKKL
jgi:ATP-dependent phosphoenolpyruvate carboxykinase